MRLLVLLILFLPVLQPLVAKPDTTLTFDEVLISGTSSVNFFPKDSIQGNRQSSNSLNPLHYSSINLREYAPGGIATFTFRGTTPQQNEVFWNGLRLNNPMTGLTDLSLFPLSLFDAVTLHPGHNKNLDFSGFSGGAILLHSRGQADTVGAFRLKLENHIDQVSNRSHFIDLYNHRGNTTFHIRGQLRNARNNFSYKNPSGEQTTAEHNHLNQKSLIAETTTRFSGYRTLSLYTWIQDTDRQIPATLFQTRSKAVQRDKSLRAGATFTYGKGPGLLFFNAGFIAEQLIYEDSLTSEFSDSDIYQFQTSARYQIQLLSNLPIQGKISYQNNRIHSTAYEEDRVEENHWDLGFDIDYEGFWDNKLRMGLKVRKGFGTRATTPLLFNAQTDFLAEPETRITASWGTHYRLPTYNDLFWPTLGNPDLKPERGWNAELGLRSRQMKFIDLVRINLYLRHTDQMIYWTNFGGTWRPENLSSVRAKGLELRLKQTATPGNIETRWTAGYDFNHNKLTEERFPGDPAKGKQLPYQPKHTVFGSLEVNWRKFTAGTHWKYSSTRYVSADHSSSLDPIILGGVHLDKKFSAAGLHWQVGIYADNVLDHQFQSVNQRPMPGRVMGMRLITKFTK